MINRKIAFYILLQYGYLIPSLNAIKYYSTISNKENNLVAFSL